MSRGVRFRLERGGTKELRTRGWIRMAGVDSVLHQPPPRSGRVCRPDPFLCSGWMLSKFAGRPGREKGDRPGACNLAEGQEDRENPSVITVYCSTSVQGFFF